MELRPLDPEFPPPTTVARKRAPLGQPRARTTGAGM